MSNMRPDYVREQALRRLQLASENIHNFTVDRYQGGIARGLRNSSGAIDTSPSVFNPNVSLLSTHGSLRSSGLPIESEIRTDFAIAGEGFYNPRIAREDRYDSADVDIRARISQIYQMIEDQLHSNIQALQPLQFISVSTQPVRITHALTLTQVIESIKAVNSSYELIAETDRLPYTTAQYNQAAYLLRGVPSQRYIEHLIGQAKFDKQLAQTIVEDMLNGNFEPSDLT